MIKNIKLQFQDYTPEAVNNQTQLLYIITSSAAVVNKWCLFSHPSVTEMSSFIWTFGVHRLQINADVLLIMCRYRVFSFFCTPQVSLHYWW